MTRELGAKQPLWQICQISKTIVRVSFNLWQGIKPFEKGREKRPKLFLYIPKISFICEVNPSGPICNSQSIMLMALDEVRRQGVSPKHIQASAHLRLLSSFRVHFQITGVDLIELRVGNFDSSKYLQDKVFCKKTINSRSILCFTKALLDSSPHQFGFRPTMSRVVAANVATTRDMSASATSASLHSGAI